MKSTRKVLALMLALVLVVNLATNASAAASNAKSLDGYQRITGRISQNEDILYAKTTILANPDNAYLRLKIEVGNALHTVSSSRGVTTFNYTYNPVRFHTTPSYMCCTHDVMGGSLYDADYTYTEIRLDSSFFS